MFREALINSARSALCLEKSQIVCTSTSNNGRPDQCPYPASLISFRAARLAATGRIRTKLRPADVA